MKFVYPWMLILVALVPVIGAFWVFLRMRAERRLTGLVAPHLRNRLLPQNPQLFKLQALLLLAGMFLAFFAAARPQWGHSAQVVQTKSRNVVVALDVSRSMLAADIRPNRLERAKADIADLIDSLEGDRCALVAFRRTGVLLCPLTTDHAFLRSALEGASPESAPRGETDLGSAIRTALDALDPAADDHNAIILISDGGDLRGGALDAAKIADKRNVPIFTVGLGNPKAETAIPDASGSGTQQYQGKTVTTKLEDATLSAIAKASGGRYVPLATAGTAETTLGAIYRRFLRQVAMKEQAEEEELRATERFVIFLVPGLTLILFAAFFSRGRFAGRNMRKAAVMLAVVMMSFTLLAQEQEEPTDVWNRAYDAYASGNVTNALSILQSRKFPPKYEARAAELIGKILFERMQKDYAENPLAAITNAEEAAVQMQIALRTNPSDARMNRNFTRAVDPLRQLRETAHVAEVLKASQNQGPDQLLGAAVREARSLMTEQGGVLTNAAAVAVAKSEAFAARAKKLSDTWIPVKQTVIQSVTNQQQAAMIVGDVEAARDATKKAAEQLADMNPEAGQTLADVESAVTRFWKAVVMPIEAITEDIMCQTNAFAAVEKFNGRDWQKESLEFTQAFREKFPQWAPQYEQHINQKLQEAAKANTNAPPPKPVFTKETQAEIMRLAEEAQKKQEEMVKQELPPVQQEIIEILKKIDELIPRDPSGGGSSQQQNQQNQPQQNQNDQQKNDDQKNEQQNQDQQQNQEEQKEQQQQEKKEEKSQAAEPKDMKDVEDLLRKAQERSDEHEADKKARARKIPSAPNERDW